MQPIRRVKPAALTLAFAAALACSGGALATPITFDTSQGTFTFGTPNQGWWSNDVDHSATNDNYLVGESGGDEYRDFFTFDLSSLTGTVDSATLQLRTWHCAGNANETYGLFDVSTPSEDLSTDTGLNAAIFSDLGSGTSYGQFNVATASCSKSHTQDFTLNAAAIAAINAAKGGYFSIGGALQDLVGGNTDQYLFGNSSNIQKLILDTGASVPEPGSLGLFGLGMAGLGLVFLRRRSALRT